MRRAEPSSEGKALERELAAIDEALVGGRVSRSEPTLQELQELGLALAEERPDPDPDWRAGLDVRVSEGFPNRRTLGSWLRRPSLPALAGSGAALAAACVALVVSLPDTTSTLESSTPQRVVPEASDRSVDKTLGSGRATPPTSVESGPSIAPPPMPGSGPMIGPRRRARRVERSASLTLAAPEQQVQRVADEIVQVVDRRRGFVLRSSLEQAGEPGTTVGSFDLRVPARTLAETLAELSRLASVRARRQASEDVTRPFDSAGDRLRSARAERRGLLRRLARARTDAEARAIRSRLRRVTREVSGLAGRLRGLRERVTYAAVTVSLVGQEESDTAAALEDARGSLLAALNIALRVLGILVPLALVGGLGWLAGSWIRRRRRESILG